MTHFLIDLGPEGRFNRASPLKHHSKINKPMGETLKFIKDRAVKTISAAKQLADVYTWSEKNPAEMQAQLEAITGNSSVSPPVIGQEEIASAAEKARAVALGQWETQLKELHRRTVQGLGMLKNKLRNDPASLLVLSNLTASSNSHKETLAEALAWESAWAKVAPAWSPTTTNTLAAFQVLRKQCTDDLQTAFTDAHAEWRQEVGKLNALANDLEQSDEAWYADATRVFPVGTPEGDMIRSTVPTTYTPSTSTPPPAPSPATSPTPSTPSAH
jgi:hypothetical protein